MPKVCLKKNPKLFILFTLLMRNAQRGSLRITGDQLHDYSCFHYPYIQFPTVPQEHLKINVV